MAWGLERISRRIPAIIVLAVVVATVSIGTVSYLTSADQVQQQSENKLIALRDSRHAELTRYFASIEEDLELLATSDFTAQALTELKRAFSGFDPSKRFAEEELLRKVFTTEKPSGERKLIPELNRPSLTRYFHTHNRFHTSLVSSAHLKGYYDIFLVSIEGDVIYTAIKEQDFATNLQFGEWSETGLAEAVRLAMADDDPNAMGYADFKPYAPSFMAPAAFVARKVIHHNRVVGTVVLQMPAGRINAIMRTTAGMGETGETYIVGDDRLMRTNSRFSSTDSILETEVRSLAAEAALRGEDGSMRVTDYRGVPVFSTYRPVTFLGANWALIAEVDIAEMEAPLIALRQQIIVISAILAILVAAGGIVVSRSITRPLSQLSYGIGDFRLSMAAVALPQTSRQDEIGEIARGFEETAREVSEYIDEINEARVELRHSADDLREREERIRTLLEVSPIGFTLARTNGEILLSNRTFRELVALPIDSEVKGSAARFYADPKDRQRYLEQLHSEGAISGLEIEWRTADDRLIWVTISAKLIDYGSEPAIMAWVNDITQRIDAEKRLRASEKIFRTVVDQLPNAMSVKGTDDRYIMVNRMWMDWYTSGNPDVVGDQPKDLFPPEVSAEINRIYDGIKKSGKPFTQELTLTLANGDDRYLHMTKFPIQEESGSIVAVASIDVDLTDVRRAEREAAEKSAVLETMMNNMSDGIIMMDEDLALVLRNDRYVELIEGKSEEFPLGVTVRQSVERLARLGYYGDGEIEDLVAQREKFFRSREPTITELKLPSERVLSVRHTPLADGGCVALFTDVTDQRRAQDRLQSILDNVPGLLIVFDRDLNYIASNPAYRQAFGFNEEDLHRATSIHDIARHLAARGAYGKGDIDQLAAERVERILSGLQTTMELQDRHYFGGSSRTPDGGLIISYADITEQRKAAQEIAEKEGQLRMALDNMPGAMTVVDQDLNVVLFNDRYTDYYGDSDGLMAIGASMEEILRKEVTADLLQMDGSPEETLRNRIDSYRSGKAERFEDHSPDGRIIQTEYTPAPDGHVITIATDITAIKQAEADLARQVAIVDTTLQNMDEGILMADAELRLLAYNQRLSEITGMPPSLIQESPTFEELVTRFLRDTLAVEDWEPHVARSMESARATEFLSYEANMGDKTVEVRQNPLEGGGFVRTFTDITDRKAAEQELQSAFEIISSSIQYASRIQRSIIPDTDFFAAMVEDFFILWEPRDVVGGDIYWTGAWGDGCLVILGDCTGHGVPGAFMTLISIGALERAMTETEPGNVGALIGRMNLLIQLSLGQHLEQEDAGDGLELGACYFVPGEYNLRFAGARFELFIATDDGVKTIGGTRSGVGYAGIPMDQEYTETEFSIPPGACCYMTSDGMIDQIGGERRRMFGKRRFRELISEIHGSVMPQQHDRIVETMKDYQGSEPRRDDLAVIGFRI